MSRRPAWAALWAIVLPSLPAWAGARLELGGTASPVAVEIRVTNAGDTAAADVAPTASYQHQVLRGEPVTLAPMASYAWNLALPPPAGPGTFPVISQVAYAEGGTTVSVPLVVLVTVPAAPPAAVATGIETVPGPGFATLRLRVENPAPRPLAGRVVFVLPSVLHTEPESEPVQVAPGEQRFLPVGITGRGARSDVGYPVYAVVEYDDDGVHQTVVARTDVSGRDSVAARAVPLAVGGLALVAAVAVLALASRAVARRRAMAV